MLWPQIAMSIDDQPGTASLDEQIPALRDKVLLQSFDLPDETAAKPQACSEQNLPVVLQSAPPLGALSIEGSACR
jgi:hypothetical protein